MQILSIHIIFISLLLGACGSKVAGEKTKLEVKQIDPSGSEESAAGDVAAEGGSKPEEEGAPPVPDSLVDLQSTGWTSGKNEAPQLQIGEPIEGLEVRIVDKNGQVISDWGQLKESYTDLAFEDSQTYTYEIRVQGDNGSYSETVAGPTWTVDASAPTQAAFSSPSASVMTVDSNYTFTWSSEDSGSGVSEYEVEYYPSADCSGVASQQTSETTNSKTLALTSGANSLEVVAIDNAGNRSTASCSPAVVLNLFPVATNDLIVVDQDSNGSLDPKANDSDPESQTLVITAVGQGSNGAVVLNMDNTVTYTPTASFHGVDQFTYTLSDSNGRESTGQVVAHVKNPFTWTGAQNALWSEPLNWHGGAFPSTSNIAIFDGTCSGQCDLTIDANANVLGLKMAGDFSGSITQATTITVTVGTSGWNQAGGSFLGGDASMEIDASLILTGGSFTSTSDVLTLSKTISGTTMMLQVDGGTFIHKSGAINFDYLAGNASGYGDIDVPNGLDFWELGFLTVGRDVEWNLGTGQQANVLNKLRIEDPASVAQKIKVNNGTLKVSGNLTVEQGASGGTASIVLDSTGNQTYTNTTGAGYLPPLTINKASGALQPSGGTTWFGLQSLTLTSGEFVAPTGELKFSKMTTGDSDVLTYTGGTFTHSSGTVTFFYNNGGANGTANLHVPNGIEFWNLNYSVENRTIGWIYGAGQTVVVNNDLTNKNTSGNSSKTYINNGTHQVKGDFTTGKGADGGTINISLIGTTDQYYVDDGLGVPPTGDWTVSKDTGSFILSANLLIDDTAQNLTIDKGTVNLNTFALTVGNILTIDTNGTLTVGGGSFTPNSGANFVNLGTLN